MMKLKNLKILALSTSLFYTYPALADFSREYIHIVGASGLIPLTKAIGNRLEKSKKLKHVPRMESTGTSGGVTLFCEGIGNDAPDILAIARPLKKKEFDTCQNHGVKDIVEIRIGYDALVFAQAKQTTNLSLSTTDLHLALSQWIYDVKGKPSLNPNHLWRDVNTALPDRKIEVLGPPRLSGTAETLIDWVTNGQNCKPGVTPPESLKTCRQLREDGGYREAREHDDSVVTELVGNPQQVAVIDYKLFLDNAKKLDSIPLEGIKPSHETLAKQTYPAIKPLYLYVKIAQVSRTPGLNTYLTELVQDATWGEKGYLAALGLVPMTTADRSAYAAKVKNLQPMMPPVE